MPGMQPSHPCARSGSGSTASSSQRPRQREVGAKPCLFPPLRQRGAGGGWEAEGATDGSLSYGIKSTGKTDLAPPASLDELSTFSSTEELVKQSPGFVLTSPTALLDGGRAGTRPETPASLLAPRSSERHELPACRSSRPRGGHRGAERGTSPRSPRRARRAGAC